MLASYFVLALIVIFWTGDTLASWGNPSSSQYHIQTDEGPERYFRYQTDNGQYRKEKRLEDGTVIGTEGWIDALGYMRLKDYIADNQGYRILKSKTVFVGKDRPIQDAIQYANKKPATAGTLYNPNELSASKKNLPPLVDSNAISDNPNPLGYDHYQTPNVFIRPNSQPVGFSGPSVPVKVPSNSIEVPFSSSDDISKPLAVYPPSSTPAPFNNNFGSPIAVYEPTQRPNVRPNSEHHISTTTISPNELGGFSTSTPRPFVGSNDLLNRHTSRFNNRPPNQYYNQLENGYDEQLPLYDGIASTSKGFRYVLPRQYHEEDNTNPNDREGSFGYIDPFGIRRVIYYNASPRGGFRFRKNNRYVGFNATPYDPRPL